MIHHALLTVDAHCDTPMRMHGSFDMGVRHVPGTPTGGQQDLIRMKEGGLAASFFALFTPQGPLTPEGRRDALASAQQGVAAVEAMLLRHPDLCEKALTPADAVRIHASGRRAIFLALENGYPLGLDLARVDAFFGQGVRYITLAHGKDNDVCASATDRGSDGERPDTGLTPFGYHVVKRMNELGIMVDLSHLSPRSVADVLRVSAAPVLASHSSARALCDHPRNLTDAQLMAIRDNGGVVQVCLVADFLKNPRENAVVTVKDLVDHIDHIVETLGIDHVGIGTDFDGGGGLTDCNDVTELPRITEELIRRGYCESDIKKIWGGNVFRVLNSVQRIAARGSA